MADKPDTIAQRVQRGAELLDRVVPGWADRVALAEVPRHRLFWEFIDASKSLHYNKHLSQSYGFEGDRSEYPEFLVAWQSAIDARRSEESAATLARRLKAPDPPEALASERPYTRPGWLARRWHEPEVESGSEPSTESPNHSPGEC
jgi:hypothetical protein